MHSVKESWFPWSVLVCPEVNLILKGNQRNIYLVDLLGHQLIAGFHCHAIKIKIENHSMNEDDDDDNDDKDDADDEDDAAHHLQCTQNVLRCINKFPHYHKK